MLCTLAKHVLECPAQSKLVLAGQVTMGFAGVALVVSAVAFITLFAPVIGAALLGAAFSTTVALIIMGSALLTALALTAGAFGLFYLNGDEETTQNPLTPPPPSTPKQQLQPQPQPYTPSSPLSSSAFSSHFPLELEDVKDEFRYFVSNLPKAIKAREEHRKLSSETVGSSLNGSIAIDESEIITFKIAPRNRNAQLSIWISEIKYNVRTKQVEVSHDNSPSTPAKKGQVQEEPKKLNKQLFIAELKVRLPALIA